MPTAEAVPITHTCLGRAGVVGNLRGSATRANQSDLPLGRHTESGDPQGQAERIDSMSMYEGCTA